MRICLYTETALPKMGGQEWVVDALARQFQALGHEVKVLAPYPRRPLRAQDESLPYPVVRHPRFYSSRYFVSWYRWWLLRLHRTWPFDVLHCHGIYPPAYLAALARPRLRVPVVITSHGGDLHEDNVRLAKPIVRQRVGQSLEAADALVAISRFTRDGFRRLCPAARNVVPIPNGVDLDPYTDSVARPVDLDPAIRPGKYALFLGRLTARKGVDLLLQALALVPANDGVQLVIAGDGRDRSLLEKDCDRLKLSGRVRFVGAAYHPVKTYLLQNALCTVVPSRVWEAFPLVVLESYAAAKPVVGSRIPGLEDLVDPLQTGWLVPEESPPALAQTLAHAFRHPEECVRLGENARRVARTFSWPAIASKHLRLYEDLLAATWQRCSA